MSLLSTSLVLLFVFFPPYSFHELFRRAVFQYHLILFIQKVNGWHGFEPVNRAQSVIRYDAEQTDVGWYCLFVEPCRYLVAVVAVWIVEI